MGEGKHSAALRAEFIRASRQASESDNTPPASPPKPGIKRLNFSHEAIIRWMLENPNANLGACANHFQYTRSWLSIIIHSDAFQAKFRELQDTADSLVLADIPAKVRGAASIAVEALANQVEQAALDQTPAPRDFLLKSSEMLLRSLGYGNGQTRINVSAPGGNVQVNTPVDSDTLSRARAKLESRRANDTPALPDNSGNETAST